MLIDALRECGLDAPAQVDLGTRLNRHRSLRGLSAMALAVLCAGLPRGPPPGAPAALAPGRMLLAAAPGAEPPHSDRARRAGARPTAPARAAGGRGGIRLHRLGGRRLAGGPGEGEVAGRELAVADAAWDTAPGFWSSIASRTIKQVAWGDGWNEVRLDGGPDGFTARYGREGRLVGVLTHERDEDYERGRVLVEGGAPLR